MVLHSASDGVVAWSAVPVGNTCTPNTVNVHSSPSSSGPSGPLGKLLGSHADDDAARVLAAVPPSGGPDGVCAGATGVGCGNGFGASAGAGPAPSAAFTFPVVAPAVTTTGVVPPGGAPDGSHAMLLLH